MAIATAASAIDKQVVTYAVRTWLWGRRERDQHGAVLIDLVKIEVRDHFKQRKLVWQLEDLADQIAERLRPVFEQDFRDVPENERMAALQAVVDALQWLAVTAAPDELLTRVVDPLADLLPLGGCTASLPVAGRCCSSTGSTS